MTSPSSDAGRIADARYRYDPNGTQREATGVSTTRRTYAYGTGYNRQGEQVFANGTLSEDFSYTHDDADRLLDFTEAVSGQTTAHTYDANGNTLSRGVVGQPGSQMQYGYNALDQLVQVDQGASPSTLLGA